MRPSASALFPFQQDNANNCLGRAQTIEDTLLAAIRCWLITKKGSRLGNMVGCFLPDMVNDLISVKDLNGVSQQLKSDLTNQFPGVNFITVTLTLDLSNKMVDLIVSITFSVASQNNIMYLTYSMPSLFQSNTY